MYETCSSELSFYMLKILREWWYNRATYWLSLDYRRKTMSAFNRPISKEYLRLQIHLQIHLVFLFIYVYGDTCENIYMFFLCCYEECEMCHYLYLFHNKMISVCICIRITNRKRLWYQKVSFARCTMDVTLSPYRNLQWGPSSAALQACRTQTVKLNSADQIWVNIAFLHFLIPYFSDHDSECQLQLWTSMLHSKCRSE